MLKRRTPTPAGHIPNSLALSKGVLYVTFLGGSQQLAAYKLQDDGSLSQIAGYGLAALGNLSGAVAPTQVVPSPDGNFVVVSAGTATNAVMSFPVKADGSLGAPVTNTAQIATPFAGAFVARTGEAPAYLSTGISSISLSSYSFSSAGALARTSQVVAAGVAAPCWLAVTPDGKFAFVGNGSGAVSSYAIGSGSTLTLVNSVAAQEPSAITGVNSVAADSWISPDGKFFYVAYLGDDKLVAYSIGSDGSLKKLGENVVGTSTRLSLQGLAGV
jgi:6-phosphogluconolactonase (cycloisomerase 2 family)